MKNMNNPHYIVRIYGYGKVVSDIMIETIYKVAYHIEKDNIA